MITWLNANAGAVMAILTLCTAVLTLCYLICTLLLVKSARAANKTSLELHKAICRPVVVCDFFNQHAVMYFRIKNIGMRGAKNIKLNVNETRNVNEGRPVGVRAWADNSVVANGVSLLTPGSEIVTVYALPGVNDLPEVEFVISYSDDERNVFEEICKFDLRAWLHDDLGRENNDPLVCKLDQIAKALSKIAPR
jgi:hypothetical protein